MSYQKLQIQEIVTKGGLSLLFAFMAAASILSFYIASKAVVILVLGVMMLALFLTLSGNPRLFSLWSMILTAPFNLGKDFVVVPHMGGAGSYTIELVDFFILIMVFFLLRDFIQGYRSRIRFSPLAFYFGGMILLGVIDVVAGPYRHVAGHEVFRMIKALIFFLVIINEVVRVKQFLHVFGALTVSVAIQAFVGIIQFVYKTNLGLQLIGEATHANTELTGEGTYRGIGEAVFRISGLLGHPNLLAAFMAMILPICIAVMFSRIRKFYKFLVGLTAVLGIIVLILTLSRAGWLSFGIAFVVLLVLSFAPVYLRTRYLSARIASLLVIVLLAAAFSGPLIKRITRSDPGAVEFRIEFMQVAWKMIKEKPILGFGLNSFVFRMAPYTKYRTAHDLHAKLGKNKPVVHNIYLLTWAEQGTIGLILFMGFHFYLLRLGIRNTRRKMSDILITINIGCVSGLLAIMADGMASFFIRNAGPARTFWIVAALIVAIDYWYKENRDFQINQKKNSIVNV